MTWQQATGNEAAFNKWKECVTTASETVLDTNEL